MIYMLHSTVPLVRANGVEVRHYLGRCRDDRLLDRLKEHRQGKNSASVVREYRRKGGVLRLVCMWPGGTAEDERALKEYAHFSQWCPICTPTKEREHGWTGLARVYRLPGYSKSHSKKLPATTSAIATTEATGFRAGPF